MEQKEIFEYLGVKESDIKTIDDFKTAFDKTFIRHSSIDGENEMVKREVGKFFTTLDSETKKLAKAHNVELGDDYKALKFINEKVDYILKKKDESYGTQITELKSQVGKNSDDVVKSWETKFNKLQNKFTETEGLLDNVKTEYEGFKVKSTNDIKSVKLSTHISKELESLKLKPTITAIERKGFMAEINDKYSFDLDENDKLFVIEKATNKRPLSTKTAGEFKSPFDVLTDEAQLAKVLLDNKDGGKPPVVMFQNNQQNNEHAPKVRVIAPRLGE